MTSRELKYGWSRPFANGDFSRELRFTCRKEICAGDFHGELDPADGDFRHAGIRSLGDIDAFSALP